MVSTSSRPRPQASSGAIFWHPYQGLWNGRLVGAVREAFSGSPPGKVAGKLLVNLIIVLDTVLLAARALARRASRTGLASVFGWPRLPTHVPILYFDLGTHKEARELAFMVQRVLPGLSDHFTAYGFEACREFCDQARARFAARTDVQLVHAALCHSNIPASGTIRLYRGPDSGLGASIYREALEEYEEVSALRFSDWVRENRLALETSICLLRMNIEGAEYDVIHDLIASGLAGSIDGFFGMWDDIAKIDPARGDEVQALLAANNITTFTFNGRDLRFRARKKCIEYDIQTSVRAGLRRIGVAPSDSTSDRGAPTW